MKDEREELVDRLFRAGRGKRVGFSAVEEHFETRLMARIAERRERRALWSAWAWRLVPWFAMIAIIIGVSGLIFDPDRSSDLFALFTGDDEYQVATLFTGE